MLIKTVFAGFGGQGVLSMGLNLTREGWLMTTMNSGDEATGDAISSLDMATVQLAVPPRTSAP